MSFRTEAGMPGVASWNFASAARVMDRVLEAYYGGRSDPFWLRPESWPGRRR